MLGWFSTKEVDRFAQALVAEVKRRTPVSSAGTLDKKSLERMSRMTDVLSNQVRAFANSQRLNVYKRARLGNQVKWALKDAGYPESFVEAFTSELVTLLAVVQPGR
ncbi:MAG: hypothetical protein ABR570_16560 [Burkholderiales bacterium]